MSDTAKVVHLRELGTCLTTILESPSKIAENYHRLLEAERGHYGVISPRHPYDRLFGRKQTIDVLKTQLIWSNNSSLAVFCFLMRNL